jgi:DNA polymerase-4
LRINLALSLFFGIFGIVTWHLRNLTCDENVKLTQFVLYESVAARLPGHGFLWRKVVVSVRDSNLSGFERQMKLPWPSCISGKITA